MNGKVFLFLRRHLLLPVLFVWAAAALGVALSRQADMPWAAWLSLAMAIVVTVECAWVWSIMPRQAPEQVTDDDLVVRLMAGPVMVHVRVIPAQRGIPNMGDLWSLGPSWWRLFKAEYTTGREFRAAYERTFS